MALYNIYHAGGIDLRPAPSTTNTGPFTLGVEFVPSVSGNVTTAKFYKASTDTGTHVGTVWTVGSPGTNLGSVNFSGETASGWQSQAFSSPIAVTAGTAYVFSVLRPSSGIFFYSANSTNNSNALTPLSVGATKGHFNSGSTNTYPASTFDNWYGLDLIFDDLGNFGEAAIRDRSFGYSGVVGYMKGITLGDTSWLGNSPLGRHMQVGITENTSDGDPAQPCLSIDIPGFWRFRWGVKPGVRQIYINAKQVSNDVNRPTMIVKANSAVGLNSDLVGTASSSTGWVTIGPLQFTATAQGVVYVELWNNDVDTFMSPALFDHRIVT